MTTSTSNSPNVALVKGQPMTNSRDVAELFGKRHADVLRALTALECSPQFTERNFALSEYRDSTGRAVRAYNMTKDGFVFLVMGFTGKEAARFKLAYIARFNEMEAELRQPIAPSSLSRQPVMTFHREGLKLRVINTDSGPLPPGHALATP